MAHDLISSTQAWGPERSGDTAAPLRASVSTSVKWDELANGPGEEDMLIYSKPSAHRGTGPLLRVPGRIPARGLQGVGAVLCAFPRHPHWGWEGSRELGR